MEDNNTSKNDDEQYTIVLQSLVKEKKDVKEKKNTKEKKYQERSEHQKVTTVDKRNHLAHPSWYNTIINSYYSQLTWGKICSVMQPMWNKQFSGSEILPGLWISDHSSVLELNALKDRKITHVVCAVLGIKPNFPKDIKYTLLPLRDAEDEDIYQFFDLVGSVIQDELKSKNAVLVHCRCGVSRSVTLVAAYLVRYMGMKHTEAIHFIQSKRPQANPNPSFREQLRSYAAKHQKQ